MTTSKENLVELIREHCKPFEGGFFPLHVGRMKEEGRSIASVSDIFLIMYALRNDKTGLREEYLGCGPSFYTGDAAMYCPLSNIDTFGGFSPRCEVKIVLDSEHIMETGFRTELSGNKGLSLTKEIYNATKVEKWIAKWGQSDEIPPNANPLLKILARNSDLLNNFIGSYSPKPGQIHNNRNWSVNLDSNACYAERKRYMLVTYGHFVKLNHSPSAEDLKPIELQPFHLGVTYRDISANNPYIIKKYIQSIGIKDRDKFRSIIESHIENTGSKHK